MTQVQRVQLEAGKGELPSIRDDTLCYQWVGQVLFVFLRSDDTATIFFAVRFSVATNREQLLFWGGIYFVRKPTDSNHG